MFDNMFSSKKNSSNLLGEEEMSSPIGDAFNSITNTNDSLCPSLSYKQRLIGFVVCLGLGILTSIASGITLIFARNFVVFGVLYSIGNVIAISATCFLVGPLRQLKNMVDPSRLIATIVFIGFLILTVVLAIVVKAGGLVIICVIFQWLAFIWYSLSYVPFAHTGIKAFFKNLIS